jgi:predicted metal-dependent hydrolase
MHIKLNGQQIQVNIRRNNKARRLILRPDLTTNSITLTLPTHAKLAQGLSFIEREHSRILGWLNTHTPQEIQNGSAIPWQGQNYLVHHDANAPRGVYLRDGVFIVGGPIEQLPARLKRWIKAQALIAFKLKALTIAARHNLPLACVGLSNAKTRWGSCSQNGRIRLNWRLILAPIWVCDAVIIHELAHLRHMNHSADFWALVQAMGGDRVHARAWLSAHGKTLYALE